MSKHCILMILCAPVVFAIAYTTQPNPHIKKKVHDFIQKAVWKHAGTNIDSPISVKVITKYNLFAKGCAKCRRDCYDILKRNPYLNDGIYTIYPDLKTPTRVFCDMTTDGGGWTVIQRRMDGSCNFYRGWSDYKRGFCDPRKEYWLGNDAIHTLTKDRSQELRIDLHKFSGEKAFAKYSKFAIASEKNKYKLSISGYSGNAEDDMIRYHNLNGMSFSTKDKNNNRHSNYAKSLKGAWWYNNSTYSNLNGVYYKSGVNKSTGIFWYHMRGKGRLSHVSLKYTKMMIRAN